MFLGKQPQKETETRDWSEELFDEKKLTDPINTIEVII
jgi:hypothetical protein